MPCEVQVVESFDRLEGIRVFVVQDTCGLNNFSLLVEDMIMLMFLSSLSVEDNTSTTDCMTGVMLWTF